MNKIFKLFSVLTVLLLVMGLSSCIIIADTDPVNYGEIDTAAKLKTFLTNGSSTAKLADDANIVLTETLFVRDDKTKTLDLNGGTITKSTGDGALITIEDGGVLTLTDSKQVGNQQGLLKNEGTDSQCYVIKVLSGGSLTVSGGNYEAERTAMYIGGTASLTTIGHIYGDNDPNNNVIGDGIYIHTGASVTVLNCSDVFGAEAAVTNFGTIGNISGGEYTAQKDWEGHWVSAIYNGGTITTIGTVSLVATNDSSSNTGNACGIFNEIGHTSPNTDAVTFTIQANGTGQNVYNQQ